jgi:Family of unknown function (DUF6445)
MFNPRPKIARVEIGDGCQAWVVDDVLLAPQALRERATAERHRFQAAPYNAYPGGWRQLPWPVDDNYPGRLKADAGQVREAGLA